MLNIQSTTGEVLSVFDRCRIDCSGGIQTIVTTVLAGGDRSRPLINHLNLNENGSDRSVYTDHFSAVT